MKNQYNIHLRSMLFWDVRQHRLAVIYRRFGTNFRHHLQESSIPRRTLEDVIDTLSRNVGNYQSTLRNTPEERRFHLHLGRSLKPQHSAELHR